VYFLNGSVYHLFNENFIRRKPVLWESPWWNPVFGGMGLSKKSEAAPYREYRNCDSIEG
jgi:hypothetical protein